MERLIGKASRGEAAGNETIERLKEQFPDYDFKLVPHETRFQIVVDTEKMIPEPVYQQMRRTAQTLDTSSVELASPRQGTLGKK